MKKSTPQLPSKNDKKVVGARQATQKVNTQTAPDDAVGHDGTQHENQDGKPSQPLQKDAIREAAAAEQTKLQRDPDALPASGFPSKRDPASAAKNNEDPVLPNPSRGK